MRRGRRSRSADRRRARRCGCRAAPSTNESAARPTERRQSASVRSNPDVAVSWRSSARSVRASERACSRSSGAGSRPARSWKSSLSISSERRSRTCSTAGRASARTPRGPSRRAERRAGRARRRSCSCPAPRRGPPRAAAAARGRRAVACTSRRDRSRRRAERLRDRPAVCRRLAEEPERGPLRERRLRARRTAHPSRSYSTGSRLISTALVALPLETMNRRRFLVSTAGVTARRARRPLARRRRARRPMTIWLSRTSARPPSSCSRTSTRRRSPARSLGGAAADVAAAGPVGRRAAREGAGRAPRRSGQTRRRVEEDFEFAWPARTLRPHASTTVTTGLGVLRALLGCVPDRRRVGLRVRLSGPLREPGGERRPADRCPPLSGAVGVEPFPVAVDLEAASAALERVPRLGGRHEKPSRSCRSRSSPSSQRPLSRRTRAHAGGAPDDLRGRVADGRLQGARLARSATASPGSNTLETQIRNGAPADLFASAAPLNTQRLFRAGLVDKPVTFTANRLALIVPKSNPAGIHSVYDLKRKPVKLVIAGAGRARRRLHAHRAAQDGPDVGALEGREPGVGREGGHRQGRARPGATPASSTPPTRAPVSDQVTVIRIPAWAQPRVRYEIAVVSRSTRKAAARAWIKTLLSAEGPDGAQERRLPPAAQGVAVDRALPRGARPRDGRRACSSCCCRSSRSSCACRRATCSRRSGATPALDAIRVTAETNAIAMVAHPRLRDAGRVLDLDPPRRRSATSSSRSSSCRSSCRPRWRASACSSRSAARACSAARSTRSGSTSPSRRSR